MKSLIVDNYQLKTRLKDYLSENLFAAENCLQKNCRFIFEGNKICNDMAWMMKILPYIAIYFNVNRKELLKLWIKDYGLQAMNIGEYF